MKHIADGEQRNKRPFTKSDLAHLFDPAINFSIQLGAPETINAMGEDGLREITKQLVAARRWHIEVMLERLRQIAFVDPLIDEQRANDAEFVKEFEEELTTKKRTKTRE
ncbi:hypothetical protein [Burkholderia sp. TSV86]|uniref:hypothetical protein n=1 Tax=Burkholderia sp. TSV86 TaxID=1385594 RepID=UPI0007537A91|nr:hypothetical protein [Burkholderia sp. TSV86]KVE34230.1 hypothetical protein WS68_10785 [Burkholderia sp. TSV86]